MKNLVVVESHAYSKELVQASISLNYSVIFIRGLKGTKFRDESLTTELSTLTSATYDCDLSSEEELNNCINRIRSYQRVDAILCIGEEVVEIVSKVSAHQKLPFTSDVGVGLVRNKQMLRETLCRCGISKIRSISINNEKDLSTALDVIGLPAILKPKRGTASLSVFPIKDKIDTGHLWSCVLQSKKHWPGHIDHVTSGEFILEKYLDGQLFSLEIGLASGKTKLLTVSYRYRAEHDESVEIGTLTPAPISVELWKVFSDYASRVVHAADLNRGVFHLEIILTNQGPEVVELNPRLMGGSIPLLYQRAYDFNVFEWLIPIYVEGVIPPFPQKANSYSLSCFFGALDDGILKKYPDMPWLENFKDYNPKFHWFIQPSMPFSKLQSNFSYIGRFILTAPTVTALLLARDQILLELEVNLGFKITRPEQGIPKCLTS